MNLANISEIRNELARRDLMRFTQKNKPDFVEGWFNRTLARVLVQFYQDVKDGKQPRVMFMAPPRSGKSELLSRQFPAWGFGQDPKLNIISSSYSATLASKMNRDVQRIISSESFNELYPDIKLSKNLCNNEEFEIQGHGGAYRSAGVGGGITGMGADIGIIDDPFKDAKEANSQTIRDSVWDWYTTTFYTRLSPKSGILLGMTRWHEDDLAGRLIEAMNKGEGDKWQIISFPAIAEEDEEFRKKGEALHPERFGLDRLSAVKRAVGTQTWNSLYQQRPNSKGGDIIKGIWFKRYKTLPRFQRVIICGDTAMKVKQANDFSVFIVMGEGRDGGIYLVDLIRGKWEAPELEQKLKDVYAKYSHMGINNVFVEDKASGTGLVQTLNRGAIIPIKGVQVDADKYTRVLSIQGKIESGYVYLPESASWVEDFITECEAFTATDSHKHDDQVDAMVIGLRELSSDISILDIV